MCVRACMRACVHACVRACVRACVLACTCLCTSALQYREEYDALLPYHDSNDYDMLWRLARVSILCREPAKDDTRKELTVQAVRLAKKAIELNGDNAMCQLVRHRPNQSFDMACWCIHEGGSALFCVSVSRKGSFTLWM